MHSLLLKKKIQLVLYLIICLNKRLLLRKAHNETDIADNAVSVSYAAVELSKKYLAKLIIKVL